MWFGSLPLAIKRAPSLRTAEGVCNVGRRGEGANGGASEDLRQRTVCVVPTWRTGTQELQALMVKEVPACELYV
jgi:hypothetical protein